MLSWKAILNIALLVGLIVLSYMRDRYKRTLSILGPTRGWTTAVAAAYPLFGSLLKFPSSEAAWTVAWWMENGNQPTVQDADTIINVIRIASCPPSSALAYVRCDIPVDSGDSAKCENSSSLCHGTGSHTNSESVGKQLLDGFYQYGVPIIGLGLMAL